MIKRGYYGDFGGAFLPGMEPDTEGTRGAIVAFTRSMAMALVDRGIRVNAVAPGPIWTPLIPASFEPEKVAQHGASSPMGRPGQRRSTASTRASSSLTPNGLTT